MTGEAWRVAWHKRESVMDRLGAQMRLTAWGAILSGNPNAQCPIRHVPTRDVPFRFQFRFKFRLGSASLG